MIEMTLFIYFFTYFSLGQYCSNTDSSTYFTQSTPICNGKKLSAPSLDGGCNNYFGTSICTHLCNVTSCCGKCYLGSASNLHSFYCCLNDACERRTFTTAALYPCGEDNCYYDNRTCTPTCSQFAHYGPNTVNGRCEMKPCAQRSANFSASASYICGSQPCFYSPSGKCSPSCLSEHYEENRRNGRCELKPCLTRTYVTTTTEIRFMCGSSDCFYDAATGQCSDVCSSQSHYTEDPSSGACVMRACAERSPNTSAASQGGAVFPCGSADCFYDSSSPAVAGTNMQCVASCIANSHRSGDADNGLCLLRECTDRALNASASFPCGSADCYYDAQNEDGHACRSTCTDTQRYAASSAEGACVLKPCGELGNKSLCEERTGVCHYTAEKGRCEDMGSYTKWRTMVVALAAVGGGVVLVVIVVVVVVVVWKCKQQAKIKAGGGVVQETEMSMIHSGYIMMNSLGVGTFSEVFLAQHRTTMEMRAIKVITYNPKATAEQTHSGRTAVEAEMNIGAAVSRTCPYLVRYDRVRLDPAAGKCYITMEYCTGGDLRNSLNGQIRAKKPYTKRELHRFVFEVGTAVKALHVRGIVHRDIKPENILLSDSGTYKLGDYGTARLLSKKSSMSMVGTSGYVAPEILRGQSDYTSSVDIYSFGCVLLEMICLRHPFKNQNNIVDVVAVSAGTTNPISDHASSYGSALLLLAKDMISVMPENRPTIANVLARLS